MPAPDYTPTIGLEIHAELSTRTKMFCNSKNDPHTAEPNVHICPVCMGYPGTLPVINKEAVRHVLRVGAAVDGTLADFSEFDRKNYFYPDIPKGYQISQYQYPLVKGGTLAAVALTRVHLEEDTARSQHEAGDYSLIDFNRAGVPLMELVTEPVIHDAETAMRFAEELQLLLRTLGASSANMEKGEMRVEANISVSKTDALGTKVEVKNLNSFRSVGRAIAFEIARHTEALERGERIVQETRGWDEAKGVTFSQRLKESSHDYRYFPDPDLPKLRLSLVKEFTKDAIVASLPELPSEKRERFQKLGYLQPQDIEQLMHDATLSALFAEVSDELKDPELIKIATNFILNDIAGERKKNPTWQILTSQHLATVVRKYHAKELASPQAKNSILTGTLVAMSDTSSLKGLVQDVIAAQPDAANEVRKGKMEALNYLVGQGMRVSKGSANPQELERMIREELGS